MTYRKKNLYDNANNKISSDIANKNSKSSRNNPFLRRRPRSVNLRCGARAAAAAAATGSRGAFDRRSCNLRGSIWGV